MADLVDYSAMLEEEHRAEAIRRIREESNLSPSGISANFCIDCDEKIPKKRQELLPGVKLCVDCAEINQRLR